MVGGPLSSRRDGTGRFKSEDGSNRSLDRHTTFDLQSEARRLYQTAQAKDDFTGAASVLRLLRDLRPDADEKATADAGWLDWLTATEKNDLDAALASIASVERRGVARRALGGDPPESYLVGADTQTWRDTPESLEERRARYSATTDGAPLDAVAPSTLEPALHPISGWPLAPGRWEETFEANDGVSPDVIVPYERRADGSVWSLPPLPPGNTEWWRETEEEQEADDEDA